MSAKTKIVVLHTKEVIYTVLFVVLAIVLAVLLFLMFGKDKKTTSFSGSPAKYHAGIYKSPITLDNNTFDVEVTVDEHEITSISMTNLSEATTAMYPLMEPALESLANQIYATQSTKDLTYAEENKYTSMLLLDAINSALKKQGQIKNICQKWLRTKVRSHFFCLLYTYYLIAPSTIP